VVVVVTVVARENLDVERERNTEFQRSPWSLKPRFADLGLGLASKLALASIYCTKYLR
jgi:hypothetical protein